MHRQTSGTSPTRTVHLGANGELVLPPSVLERMSLKEHDTVLLDLEPGGALRLRSLRAQVQRGLGLFRDLAPGVSLADELIRERREVAAAAE